MRVTDENGRPLNLGSPTTRSLLAYLALNRQRPLDRRHLAFVFWSQASETAARRNLRQYLHRLRAALAPVEHRTPVLAAAENTVQLISNPDLWIDVEQFEHGCRSGGAALEHAVALYGGNLLEDLYDDWIAPERERLRQMHLAALEQLAEYHRAAGRTGAAVAVAQRLLAADPLQERSHALLMTLYYAQGDRARALQQFKVCSQALEEALGVEPLPETRALYDALAAGTYPAQAVAAGAPALGVAVKPATSPPRAPVRPVEATAPPFIGRERELAQLDAWFGALRGGHGRMVLVQGEPGAGKTRLVQEALCRACEVEPAPAVFSGEGREFEALAPYHPLAAALRAAPAENLAAMGWPAWAEVLAPSVPDVAARAGWPVPPAAAARFDRYQLGEALGAFFLEQAARGPVVLCLDDVQWADSPTWQVLAYLARRCADAPLLVICLAPPEDLPADTVRLARTLQRQGLLTVLDVPALTREETAQLASGLGLQAEEVLTRRLYEETAGNAFFVVEAVQALLDASGTWTLPVDAAGRRPAFAVPLRVRAVIEARLDRLESTSRQLLSAAAAIGHTFPIALLHEVADAPRAAVIDALEDWLARRLVHELSPAAGAGLVYQFDHEQIRRVAYEQLSHPRRQWLHRRIAEALAAEPGHAERDPGEVAQHFLRGETPAQALPYLIAAGERALSARSYATARQFGVQAVGLLKDVPASSGRREEQIDLSLQLALAYSFTGEVDRALAILQQTEALATALDDRGRLGRTYYRTAQVSWRCGRVAAASEYARRALRVAEESGDPQLQAAGLRMLGRTAITSSAFDDAISVLQRFLAQVPAEPPRSEVAVVHGYLGVAWARVGAWTQALESAVAGVRCAEAILGPTPLAAAQMQLAFVQAERHDWPACLDTARRGLALAQDQDTGFSPHGFMLQALLGHALCQQGARAEGQAQITEALAAAEANDYRIYRHMPHLFLAQAWSDVEARPPEAAQAVERAYELATEAGDRWAQAVALRLRADWQSREPVPVWTNAEADLVTSRDLLRQVRARPELARTYLSMRRLYERAGQMAWAVDCHFRATAIFEELGMTDELRAAQGTPLGAAGRGGRGVVLEAVLRGPHG